MNQSSSASHASNISVWKRWRSTTGNCWVVLHPRTFSTCMQTSLQFPVSITENLVHFHCPLLKYTGTHSVCIDIENHPHFLDYPNPCKGCACSTSSTGLLPRIYPPMRCFLSVFCLIFFMMRNCPIKPLIHLGSSEIVLLFWFIWSQFFEMKRSWN